MSEAPDWIAADDIEWCAGCQQKHSKCSCIVTVSDPGAGQQQGREWCVACDHSPGSHDIRGCLLCAERGTYCRMFLAGPTDYAPSPTPPARDSGRDEAREAVARSEMIAAIRAAAKTAEDTPCDMDVSGDCADNDCPSCSSPVLPFATRGGVITSVYADVEELVDLLLALPELDKLLRRPA